MIKNTRNSVITFVSFSTTGTNLLFYYFFLCVYIYISSTSSIHGKGDQTD